MVDGGRLCALSEVKGEMDGGGDSAMKMLCGDNISCQVHCSLYFIFDFLKVHLHHLFACVSQASRGFNLIFSDAY